MTSDFESLKTLARERLGDGFADGGPNAFSVATEDGDAIAFFRAGGEPEGEICVRAKVLDLDGVARPGDFAKSVLGGNFFWSGTRGATLSVGTDGGLWLTERRAIDELSDAEGFRQCLDDFAETLSDWRERSALHA
ncbi:MAG: type III secretion system chaperone [Kiritimatiellae bacterium]|nr:type III secretion system chaperone [Kiritimatiellia bacterium]